MRRMHLPNNRVVVSHGGTVSRELFLERGLDVLRPDSRISRGQGGDMSGVWCTGLV